MIDPGTQHFHAAWRTVYGQAGSLRAEHPVMAEPPPTVGVRERFSLFFMSS